MVKKETLPVIEKNGKWYNTLTGKYVSKSYARRINNYFLKNPDGTLVQATGHAKYSTQKSWQEHSRQIRKLAYKKGNQLIKTKDKKGKEVYLSPFNREVLSKTEIKKLKNLDYYICRGKVHVELYRLTKDRTNIYHILTWFPNKRLSTAYQVDFWKSEAIHMFNCIVRELRKIAKHHRFSNITIMYGHVSCYFISDYDAWQNGKTFGFVIPNNSGFEMLRDQFLDILEWYHDKLETDAYHDIHVEKITFYMNDFISNATETQIGIAKYRLGVNKLMK